MAHAVEFTQIIKHPAALLAGDAVGVLQIQYRIAACAEFHALKARRQKPATPIEIIKNLTAGRALAHAGHHHKRRQTIRVASQPIAEPRAHRRPTGHFRAGHEKRNRRRMVYLLSVHALDEANIIGRLAHVWGMKLLTHARFCSCCLNGSIGASINLPCGFPVMVLNRLPSTKS